MSCDDVIYSLNEAKIDGGGFMKVGGGYRSALAAGAAILLLSISLLCWKGIAWHYMATDLMLVLVAVGSRDIRREYIKTQASLKLTFEGWDLVFATALTGCSFALLVLICIAWNRIFNGIYLPRPEFVRVANHCFQVSMGILVGLVGTVTRKL